MGRIRTTVLAAVGGLCAALLPSGAVGALDDPVVFWDERTTGLAVNGTYVPIVGDFGGAGAGLEDVIWYAPGAGVDHVWYSDGDGTFTKALLAPQVSGTYTPLVGDFAGSGLDDIYWYGPGPVPDFLWTNQDDGTFSSSTTLVVGRYHPVVLDDAVGKDDIVWVRPEGGPGTVWSFEGGGSYINTPFTAPAGARPLTGFFDGGVCADLFWYAPGPAPDALWSMNCAGSPGSVVPQTVNGTYWPTVERYSPNGDDLDDILWYRSPGLSTLWASDGDGTWTASWHDIPLLGLPIPASRTYGFAHVWSTTQQDLVFWDLPAGDFVAPLLNTELGAGYVPVLGSFLGTGADVFWYRPGPSPERLFSFAE